MSERAYFLGDLEIPTADRKKALETIKSSMDQEDDTYIEDVVSINEKGLHIDGRVYGSIPSMTIEGLEKAIGEVAEKHLAKPATLEYFYFSDGYYKINIKPGSKDLKREFVSKYDPYSDSIEFLRLLEEVLLENGLPADKLNEISSSFLSISKKYLLEGKIVWYPLVRLWGKGIKTKEGRKVRNPQSGEEISVPASHSLEIGSHGGFLAIPDEDFEKIEKFVKERAKSGE